eukprot:17330-Heterococcus_DN1.PRE.2
MSERQCLYESVSLLACNVSTAVAHFQCSSCTAFALILSVTVLEMHAHTAEPTQSLYIRIQSALLPHRAHKAIRTLLSIATAVSLALLYAVLVVQYSSITCVTTVLASRSCVSKCSMVELRWLHCEYMFYAGSLLRDSARCSRVVEIRSGAFAYSSVACTFACYPHAAAADIGSKDDAALESHHVQLTSSSTMQSYYSLISSCTGTYSCLMHYTLD